MAKLPFSGTFSHSLESLLSGNCRQYGSDKLTKILTRWDVSYLDRRHGFQGWNPNGGPICPLSLPPPRVSRAPGADACWVLSLASLAPLQATRRTGRVERLLLAAALGEATVQGRVSVGYVDGRDSYGEGHADGLERCHRLGRQQQPQRCAGPEPPRHSHLSIAACLSSVPRAPPRRDRAGFPGAPLPPSDPAHPGDAMLERGGALRRHLCEWRLLPSVEPQA